MASSGDAFDDLSTLIQGVAHGQVSVGAFVLNVIEGPDRGAVLTFDANRPSRILIGTSPVCDLRLTDREVSRRHVSLEMTERGLLLQDLASKNGTSVNG